MFKTDFSLNGVNMCYEFGDMPSTFTVPANTISLWNDMSTYEPMVVFNLANGPFLETISFSLNNQDISNIYPLPDTTGQCRIPRLDPLVLPKKDIYISSTKQQYLSFKEEHCQGAPMTVTTGTLPTFATITNNIINFNPT